MLDFLELERGLSDLEITKDLLRTAAAKAWLARNKDRATAGTETGDDPYPTFQSQVAVAERTQATDQVPSFFHFPPVAFFPASLPSSSFHPASSFLRARHMSQRSHLR
jgi:hypothetical protein